MIYVANAFYADTNYLEHHGVLNMKWGVRRWQNKDGTLTEAGKRRAAQLAKKQEYYAARSGKYAREKERLMGTAKSDTESSSKKEAKPQIPKAKSVSEMTDDELKKMISRLELEKSYDRLLKEKIDRSVESKPQSRELTKGQKVVSDILTTSLTNVGKNVGENALGMGINKFGKMLGLERDLYTAFKLNPVPGQKQQNQDSNNNNNNNNNQRRRRRR